MLLLKNTNFYMGVNRTSAPAYYRGQFLPKNTKKHCFLTFLTKNLDFWGTTPLHWSYLDLKWVCKHPLFSCTAVPKKNWIIFLRLKFFPKNSNHIFTLILKNTKKHIFLTLLTKILDFWWIYLQAAQSISKKFWKWINIFNFEFFYYILL